MPSGGEVLINILAAEGVRHVFTVPGESFLAVLDAMHSDVRVRPVTCRHESGAAMMAEATGKLTGRPGIALVTRGPGAANALAGIYVAQQDATPMILLVGLPPRPMQGLPAFQAIDIEALFGGIAKWVTIVASAEHLQRTVVRGFRMALSGRGGPVVIGIPEDILSDQVPAIAHVRTEPMRLPPQIDALDQIKQALAHAERPLLITGGSEWSEVAALDLATFAERFDLPVVASFRRQDHLDNRHRCYVGHAGFAPDRQLTAGIKASDLIIALGTRLGDITTQGFSLLNGSASDQKIIHIATDAGAPDSNVAAAQTLGASAVLSVAALAMLPLPGKRPPWGIWRRDLRAAYEASLKPQATPGDVQLEDVIAMLSQMLPTDAIITSGAGNYAAFLHRYFVHKSYPSQLAPASGSMGYGLPAAIAAKLAAPQRTVVAIAGDGCLQMTSQELMTAVQFGLGLIIIIANNRTLGTIRMHQERRYPGRVVATSLMNPDFVAWAKSCGAHAERVETTDAFAPALERALSDGRASVIELVLDSEAISPVETITSLRNAASKRNDR
ncbi:MAG: thiamine pyrophosphate-dependent enzyme [Hyphomicrobium sp.]